MYNEKDAKGKLVKKYHEEDFLKVMKKGEFYTIREVEHFMKCSKDTTHRNLVILEKRGFVKSKKTLAGWLFWIP